MFFGRPDQCKGGTGRILEGPKSGFLRRERSGGENGLLRGERSLGEAVSLHRREGGKGSGFVTDVLPVRRHVLDRLANDEPD